MVEDDATGARLGDHAAAEPRLPDDRGGQRRRGAGDCRSGAAFDLLFTDVIMPACDERPAARRRDRAGAGPALKVLFTSGYTENAIIHHGRLDPGVLLLAKPYRKSDLARMIRTALDGDEDFGRARCGADRACRMTVRRIRLRAAYCALMPAALMTGHHRSSSAL